MDNINHDNFFDIHFIKEHYKNRYNELENILKMYIEDFDDKLKSIKIEFQNKSYKKISNLGHGLKGVSAICGLPILSEIGKTIQNLALNNDLDGISNEIEKLEYFSKNLEIIIKDFINNIKNSIQ
ncbi:MAG TPA: Hpt domain-containing protein [Spirochaetota bacterium]|nr:Hpt domain-containing protein [Spirochaetota bacterium]